MAKKSRVPQEPTVAPEAEAEGLEDVIALDQVIAALDAQRRIKMADLKPLLFSYFFENKGVRSFQAVEGRANAQCQMKRRASNRPLTADELRDMARFRISARLGRSKMRLNPKHADNETVMKTLVRIVAEARRNGVELPDDLFVQSDAAAVVTDAALNKVLELRGPDALRLVETVSDVSLSKSEITGGDPLRYAGEVIERMLNKDMASA